MTNKLDKEHFLKVDKILGLTKSIDANVKSVDAKVNWIIRAQGLGVPLIQKFKDFFSGDSCRGEVYLEINGEKSSKEIAESLDVTLRTIQYHLKSLKSHALIESTGKRGVYKKAKIDSILDLSKHVETWIGK